MLKVLFVVRGFYPDISASGNLLLPLVRELNTSAKVDILTFSEETSYSEIDNIKIYRIGGNQSFIGKVVNKIKREISMPYKNDYLVSKSKSEIERLYKLNSYDRVIAVTYEEILGLALSNIPKDKKGFFLLEKLHETSKFTFIKYFQRKRNLIVYEKLYHDIDTKFLLPGLSGYFPPIDKNALIELEHPMVVDNVRNVPMHNGKVLLIYIGGLDLNQRNPWPIINIIDKLGENTEFEIFGYGNAITDESKLPRCCRYGGLLKKDEINEQLDKASFLISIGNKEADIFPSKIFDYLSTGIPIIHFSQNLDDPYYTYLEGYSNAIIISLSNLENEIDNICSFITERSRKRDCFSNIEKRFYEQTPKYNSKKILAALND